VAIAKPRYVKMPSPNFFEPGEMKVNQVAAVVLHGTASYGIASAIDWLRNPRHDKPGAAVSASYAISKGGVIYELVPFESGLRAWANGIVENYDTSLAWLVNAVKNKINPNWITVSIEHEATSDEMQRRASMTDAQFNSSIDLTAYILAASGLRAGHETIIGHNQISGTKKYNCPGVIFPPAYTEQLLIRHAELK
jgi:N-acetyl-anhydromuramyl-L-alanine amidase AmpD